MTHIQALKKTKGNATQAAKLMGVSVKTFYNHLPEKARKYLQGRTVESPKVIRSFSLSQQIVESFEQAHAKQDASKSEFLEAILNESDKLN